MRNNKIRNSILLILLVAIPFSIFFSNFMMNGLAFEPVPEPHPYNGWGWDVNIGDRFWFEYEVIDINESTGDTIHMFKNIHGFEITGFDISRVNIPWRGSYNLSRVNATDIYYDLNNKTVQSSGQIHPIAHFGYNNTEGEIYFGSQISLIPMLLPLNGSGAPLDVEYLDDIILNYFYDPLAMDGKLNWFDYTASNNGNNNLFFGTYSTPNYFINATYFDDGTLKEAESFILQDWGSDTVEIYQKIKRASDWNIIDEVEWGANIGDVFYFADYNKHKGLDQLKLNITGTNEAVYNGYWSHNPWGIEPMIFQVLLADISVWNPATYTYDIQAINVPVGAANNFYPSLPWQANLTHSFSPFLFNKNATLDAFEFMQNNFTAQRYVNMDEIHCDFKGILMICKGISYSSGFRIWASADMERGVMTAVRSGNDTSTEYLMFETGQNSTSNVRWSIDVGDELYYGERRDEFKAIITEINTIYIDMWEFEEFEDLMPRFYVFSEVYANLSRWNVWDERWEDLKYGDWDYNPSEQKPVLIATANNYWPLGPYFMMTDNIYRPPLLYPKNTSGYDFNKHLIRDIWDEFIFEQEYFHAYKYSDGTEHVTYLDLISGIPLFTKGYRYNEENWNYEFYSSFKKYRQPLSSGSNMVLLKNRLVPEFHFVANILTYSSGAEFLYSILPDNPTPQEIPNGNLLCYADLMVTRSYIVDSISITISMPSEIDIEGIRIMLFKWEWYQYDEYNYDGNWNELPYYEMEELVSYDPETNSITITLYVNEPIANIFAFAYEEHWEDDGGFEGEIPGYEIFIVIGLIGMMSIILLKKRRDSISKNLRIK